MSFPESFGSEETSGLSRLPLCLVHSCVAGGEHNPYFCQDTTSVHYKSTYESSYGAFPSVNLQVFHFHVTCWGKASWLAQSSFRPTRAEQLTGQSKALFLSKRVELQPHTTLVFRWVRSTRTKVIPTHVDRGRQRSATTKWDLCRSATQYWFSDRRDDGEVGYIPWAHPGTSRAPHTTAYEYQLWGSAVMIPAPVT